MDAASVKASCQSQRHSPLRIQARRIRASCISCTSSMSLDMVDVTLGIKQQAPETSAPAAIGRFVIRADVEQHAISQKLLGNSSTSYLDSWLAWPRGQPPGRIGPRQRAVGLQGERLHARVHPTWRVWLATSRVKPIEPCSEQDRRARASGRGLTQCNPFRCRP